MDAFNPVLYSTEENQFLLENVGLAPIVAFNKRMPEGVNPRAVRPVLQEVFDREQLRSAQQVEWLGIDGVKSAITAWVAMDEKWAEDHRRSRGRIPRRPSMYMQDGKGKYHLAASGSDSNFPRTYTDPDGNRRTFEVSLDGLVADEDEFFGQVKSTEAPKSLIDDVAKHRLECPICNHAESYDPNVRSTYNMARARMSRHLKKAKVETSLHHELHTNEFGS